MPRGIHRTSCTCRICACRRASKAVAQSTGAGGSALDTIRVKEKSLDTDNFGTRARVAAWLAARTEDPSITQKEIAERLGVHPRTIERDLQRAHREGWLQFDDQLDRMKYEIVPKVVDNLSHFLSEKDRTVTLETAKGTIFKIFQESEGISDAPQTVLALKIEAVDPDQAKIITGQIVGRPKELRE